MRIQTKNQVTYKGDGYRAPRRREKRYDPPVLYPAKTSNIKVMRHLRHITPKRILIKEPRQNINQCEGDSEAFSATYPSEDTRG